MKQSHVNAIVCCHFLASIAAFTAWGARPAILLPAFLAAFVGAALVRSLRRAKTILVILACVFLAFLLVSKKQGIPNSPAHVSAWHGEYTQVVGQVRSEVVRKVDRQEFVLEAQGDPHGRLLVYAPLFPERQLGEHLRVSCKVTDVRQGDSPSFARYLSLRDIYATCWRPKVEPVESPAEVGLDARARLRGLGALLWAKGTLGHQVQKLFPEPSASLLLGLLTGERTSIPEGLKENLRVVGLTHIIAISGYNVSIIINVAFAALLLAGLWRRQAFWASLVFIFAFCAFVGGGASIMRASIMAAIALIARQAGRLLKRHLLLLYSASIMAALNPYVLLFDIGFQLSFGATLGLLYVEPALGRYVRRLPGLVRESLSTTLAATIMVQPLITAYFSQVSLIALVANLLVLPAIPIIMLSGFVATCLSFPSLSLGRAAAVFPYLLLKYIELAAGMLARVPYALVPFEGAAPKVALVGINVLVIMLILWIGRRPARAR